MSHRGIRPIAWTADDEYVDIVITYAVPVLAAVLAALRAYQAFRSSSTGTAAVDEVPEGLRVHPTDPP